MKTRQGSEPCSQLIGHRPCLLRLPHRDILELLLDSLDGLGGSAGGTGGPSSLRDVPIDAAGRSPLHLCSANGDYAGVQLLLARGADVDVSCCRLLLPTAA